MTIMRVSSPYGSGHTVGPPTTRAELKQPLARGARPTGYGLLQKIETAPEEEVYRLSVYSGRS